MEENERLSRIEARQDLMLEALNDMKGYPVTLARFEEALKSTNSSLDNLEKQFTSVKDDAFKFIGLGGSIIIIINWIMDHVVR